MKKAILCTIIALCFFMLAGCKKERIEITSDDVQTNTILVNNDGSVQVATVETFDKDYYNLTDLNNFINEEIKNYNTEAGEEAITLKSLELKNKDAVLILNYSTLEHYKKFNQVEAAFTSTSSVKNGEIEVPDVFINAKDGTYVSKEIALENEKYKVLVVNENTDLIVNGKIKYYSTGALVNSSKLQTAAEGETVVIFKP